MKLLLDEQLPRKLAQFFPDTWSVSTVQSMGWSGVANGKLLAIAAENQFDALLTADKNLQYQQDVSNLPIPVIVLASFSTRIADLTPLVPTAIEVLSANPQNGVHRIETNS